MRELRHGKVKKNGHGTTGGKWQSSDLTSANTF